MERAYSLFSIKSIDDEQRIIEGVASTPEPDRQGDVIESAGAKFTLPMPFLWQHRADQPLGQVIEAAVTPAGIRIRAQIAKGVLPFIEDAWTLIKAGLVPGLSIGWLPIDAKRIAGSFGLHVKAWHWFEVSAVTVPANAQTTIQRIKSIDAEHLAALSEPRVASAHPPGVSGTARVVHAIAPGHPHMKTYTEQIASFEATRQAKAADRNAIMQKAADEGVTLDAEQKTHYDALDAEIKEIAEHLTRLRALEVETKAAAVPAVGGTPADAAMSRIGVIQVKDNTPPGIGFARAVMCKMQAFKEYRNAAEIAKERYPHDPRVHAFLKTAVPAAGTTDATYMGALVDPSNLAGEFLEFLRPMTIVDRIPNLRRVPPNVRIIGQTTGGTGYWVGQGAPKPVTRFGVAPTTLGFAKVAAISVLTEELARFSSPSAEALVRDQLAACLVERLDIDFIDPAKAAVAGISPASITNGITGITATADALTDLAALLGAFLEDNLNPADAVFIMPNSVALVLALQVNASGGRAFPDITMNGGTLLGIPVVASQYAATIGTADSAVVILANARQILMADDGSVTVDVSREASLQMDDAPTNSSATPTATSLVSMFQTNSIALRAERFINWARARTTAVAWLDAVGYVPTPATEVGTGRTPIRPSKAKE